MATSAQQAGTVLPEGKLFTPQQSFWKDEVRDGAPAQQCCATKTQAMDWPEGA